MRKLLLILLLPSVMFGATITCYVNTGSTAGGDGTTNATTGDNRAYASKSEMEAARQQNLTDNGGDILMVYCSGVSTDTTACTYSGWTTSETCYIDDSGDFTGTKYDATKYKMSVAAGDALTITNNTYVRLHNQQFIQPGKTAIVTSNNSTCTDYIYANLIINTVSANGNYAYRNADRGTYYFHNNILLGWRGDGGGGCAAIMNYSDGGGNSMNISYNTIDSAGIGSWGYGVTLGNIYQTTICKGNIVRGYLTNWTPFNGTFAAGTDYNSVERDTTSYTVTGGGNTHDRVSQTFTFVDATSSLLLRDYALTSSDTGALDVGPSSDITSGIVNVDCVGTERPQNTTYDLGAFCYPVGSPPAPAAAVPFLQPVLTWEN